MNNYQGTHMINRVSSIANQLNLGVPILLENDPYREIGPIENCQIKRALIFKFETEFSSYQLPQLLTKALEEKLRLDARLQYTGKKMVTMNEAKNEEEKITYTLDQVIAIGGFIEKLLLSEQLPADKGHSDTYFLKYFICDDNSNIIDLNRSFIEKIFFKELRKQGYICIQQPQNLLECALYFNFLCKKDNDLISENVKLYFSNSDCSEMDDINFFSELIGVAESAVIKKFCRGYDQEKFFKQVLEIEEHYPEYYQKLIKDQVFVTALYEMAFEFLLGVVSKPATPEKILEEMSKLGTPFLPPQVLMEILKRFDWGISTGYQKYEKYFDTLDWVRKRSNSLLEEEEAKKLKLKYISIIGIIMRLKFDSSKISIKDLMDENDGEAWKIIARDYPSLAEQVVKTAINQKDQYDDEILRELFLSKGANNENIFISVLDKKAIPTECLSQLMKRGAIFQDGLLRELCQYSSIWEKLAVDSRAVTQFGVLLYQQGQEIGEESLKILFQNCFTSDFTTCSSSKALLKIIEHHKTIIDNSLLEHLFRDSHFLIDVLSDVNDNQLSESRTNLLGLLKQNFDVLLSVLTMRNNYGYNALFCAIDNGDIDSTNAILQAVRDCMRSVRIHPTSIVELFTIQSCRYNGFAIWFRKYTKPEIKQSIFRFIADFPEILLECQEGLDVILSFIESENLPETINDSTPNDIIEKRRLVDKILSFELKRKVFDHIFNGDIKLLKSFSTNSSSYKGQEFRKKDFSEKLTKGVFVALTGHVNLKDIETIVFNHSNILLSCFNINMTTHFLSWENLRTSFPREKVKIYLIYLLKAYMEERKCIVEQRSFSIHSFWFTSPQTKLAAANALLEAITNSSPLKTSFSQNLAFAQGRLKNLYHAYRWLEERSECQMQEEKKFHS
ncbi:hypothetical protein [Coxiella burnetii]|uniref:hypothetical protein n=2 Tax=Coxiella burnetii TaxID=777 RepID=UPI0021F14D5B|nr:hypothetical protein [Coxiella burnetii]